MKDKYIKLNFIFTYLQIMFLLVIFLNQNMRLIELTEGYINFLQYLLIITYSITILVNLKSGMHIGHPYILFLVTIFIFNISRIFLDIFGIVNFYENEALRPINYSLQVQENIILIILTSINFLNLGVIIGKPNKCIGIKLSNHTYYEKTGLIMFFMGLPAKLIRTRDIITSTIKYGYLNIFTNNETIYTSNFLINIFDDFYKIGFILFLISIPSKSKLKKIIPIYLLISLANIFSGTRTETILDIFFITAYLVLRYKEKIKSKFIFIIGISMVFLSQFIAFFRTAVSSDVLTNDMNPILEFFIDQGISINVIGLTIRSQDTLIGNKMMYLFHDLIYFLKYNIFTKLLGVTPPSTLHEKLTNNYLGSDLTYITNSQAYFRGMGIGSSYMSEIWVGYGIVGIAIFSTIIGFIIIYSIRKLETNRIIFYIFLTYLPVLFFSPRSSIIKLQILERPIIIIILLSLLFKEKVRSNQS